MKIGSTLVGEILRLACQSDQLRSLFRSMPPEHMGTCAKAGEVGPHVPGEPFLGLSVDQGTLLFRHVIVTVLKNEPLPIPDAKVVRVVEMLNPQADPRSVVGLLDDPLGSWLKVGIVRLVSSVAAFIGDPLWRPHPVLDRLDLKALDPLDPGLAIADLPHQRGGIGLLPP